MNNPILDDYRAGLPIRDIAERHGVSPKTVCRRARAHGLRRQDLPEADGGEKTTLCVDCGGVTWAKSSVCRGCQTERRRMDDDHQPVTGLTDGDWVPNGRGIVVWKADAA